MFTAPTFMVICYNNKRKLVYLLLKQNGSPRRLIVLRSTLTRFNLFFFFPYEGFLLFEDQNFGITKAFLFQFLNPKFLHPFLTWLLSSLICFPILCLLKKSPLVLWLRTESYYPNVIWSAQWYNYLVTAKPTDTNHSSFSYFPLTFIEHWCRIYHNLLRVIVFNNLS